MQIFKDKQLRNEFEQFKKDVLDQVETLEKKNSILDNENTLLRKRLATLEKEFAGKVFTHEMEYDHSPLKAHKSNNKPSKSTEEVVFGGNSLNKDSQKIYKSLTFDGFWFKSTRGKASNKRLCNIHQVLLLKDLQNEKNISWAEISKSFGVSARVLQKISFNVLKGTFDEYIKEYRKTKFSLRKGKLYINNKSTTLSELNVCEIVISYIDNPSEKTLNKLVKSYPNAKQEHIITICDNYDSVPLKRRNYHVALENNPQKRKEKGMS